MSTKLNDILRAEFYASATTAASLEESALLRVAGQLVQIGDSFASQYKKSMPRLRKQKKATFESMAMDLCLYVAFHVLRQLH